MADHGKAGNLFNFATLHVGFRKAPVHLVNFTWLRLVAKAAGSLRNYKNSFCRNKVMMLLDIHLHLGKTAIIPSFTHSIKANLGVGYPFCRSKSSIPVNPVRTVLLACMPVRPWGFT